MFFSRSNVGIDIGPKFIKAVHMYKNRRGFSLENAMKLENPIGKITFLEQREQELMAESLANIRKLSCKSVVIGVSNRHLAFRNIHLPKLTKKELREAIYWECQEFSSIFNGEFVSDYHIVEENPNYLRVFLAGAEKRYVQNLSDIAKRAGLNLVALDAYPLAIERLLKLKGRDKNTAVLDIGPYYSDLTLLERGKIFSLRTIPLGSRDIDEEKSVKLPQEHEEKGKDWVREIQQFFHYFSLQTQGQRIDLLLISGEGNEHLFLKSLLSRELQIPVKTVDALNFDFKKRVSEMSYSDYFNAIGFAMRG